MKKIFGRIIMTEEEYDNLLKFQKTAVLSAVEEGKREGKREGMNLALYLVYTRYNDQKLGSPSLVLAPIGSENKTHFFRTDHDMMSMNHGQDFYRKISPEEARESLQKRRYRASEEVMAWIESHCD